MSPVKLTLRNLVFGRCRQSVEDGLTVFGVAHVDAIQGKNMQVNVQPQSGIEPLHERDGPGLCVGDAFEPERALGAPGERAAKLAHERAEHAGA
jgi:hypothetical protein